MRINRIGITRLELASKVELWFDKTAGRGTPVPRGVPGIGPVSAFWMKIDLVLIVNYKAETKIMASQPSCNRRVPLTRST